MGCEDQGISFSGISKVEATRFEVAEPKPHAVGGRPASARMGLQDISKVRVQITGTERGFPN